MSIVSGNILGGSYGLHWPFLSTSLFFSEIILTFLSTSSQVLLHEVDRYKWWSWMKSISLYEYIFSVVFNSFCDQQSALLFAWEWKRKFWNHIEWSAILTRIELAPFFNEGTLTPGNFLELYWSDFPNKECPQKLRW